MKVTWSPTSRKLIFSVFAVAIGLIAYWQTFGFAEDWFSWDVSSPGTYPRVVIALTVVLSLTAIVMYSVTRSSPPELQETSNVPDRDTAGEHFRWAPLAMIALFAIYALVLNMVGFVIASAAFLLAGQLLILRSFAWKKVTIAVIISVIGPLAMDYLFTNVLRVFLP